MAEPHEHRRLADLWEEAGKPEKAAAERKKAIEAERSMLRRLRALMGCEETSNA